jgi:hypothetical protein
VIGVGIDPGTSLAPIARCRIEAEAERIEPDAGANVLPSIALLDEDGFATSLETKQPLLPFGVGGSWPPEAESTSQRGAMRMPMALALARLDRTPTSAGVEAGKAAWAWPRTGSFQEQQPRQEQIGVLLRRTIARIAEESRSPVALAVPNGLPLIDQTMIVGRLGRSARLIWRCMAAGLYYAHAEKQTTRRGSREAVRDGSKVLHVHLGLDGFEATVFSYALRQGDCGPNLLVPLRSRSRPDQRSQVISRSWSETAEAQV